MDVLEYLRETSCELAALADKDHFESLAYIFRMAALDADKLMAQPAAARAAPAREASGATAAILPFRLMDRR
jgi:hypothetical protein